MISNNVRKQIVNNTSIVEVVSEYLPLTRKGNSYFGVCPFHDDHSPSMSVSQEKQIFVATCRENEYTKLKEFSNIIYLSWT